MNTITIYLTFDGNCEEAFNFYKDVFGGEFESISRFDEMPDMGEDSEHSFPEDEMDRIMHVSLPIGGGSVLMGSDTGGEYRDNFIQGNNFSISVTTDSKEEADRLFNELSDGGHPIMPMEQSFWGSYFGMLTDQFGIQWMISLPVEEE